MFSRKSLVKRGKRPESFGEGQHGFRDSIGPLHLYHSQALKMGSFNLIVNSSFGTKADSYCTCNYEPRLVFPNRSVQQFSSQGRKADS